MGGPVGISFSFALSSALVSLWPVAPWGLHTTATQGPSPFFWEKVNFGWFYFATPGLRGLLKQARILVNPRNPRPAPPDARKRRKRPSGAKRGTKRQNCQGFCAVIWCRQLRFAPQIKSATKKKGKTKRCDKINWEGRNFLFREKYFSNPA